MIGALLSLALATPPEILLPPWPLSPDGDLVGVRGAALTAEGAAVEPIAPGLYRVVPAEGAGEVRLAAGEARARAPVEPPPAEVTIAFTPKAPVKGRNRQVALDISVAPGAAPDPRPPELVASSGRVRDVVAAGPGRFRAVYELAATRHPEVAVLLALVPRCPTCATPAAIGHAVIPVSAAIDLPGESQPGVKSTVVIGGRSFGPVVADGLGRFTVPVVVPPGERFGVADSADALGNRRRTEIDLRVPPVNRLACAAWPRVLPADGRSQAAIWCVASSAAGMAEPAATLSLAARVGKVSPARPFREALQRAIFHAPSGGGGTAAILSASYPAGGAASSVELRIALVTGAPSRIEAAVPGEPVALGATVPARTAVRDARGDVLGSPRAPADAVDGFVAPDRFVARASPGDYVQRAPLAFALAPGDAAATLSLAREGAGWLAVARTIDARPAAGVPLRFGSGAVVTTDARGEAHLRGGGPRESVVAPNGARAAGFEGVPHPAAPFELARTVAVALRPSAPVDVTARLEGGWLRWRVVDARGTVLRGRAVALRSGGVSLGPPAGDGDGGRAEVRGGHGLVAIVDVVTGIATVVEVP